MTLYTTELTGYMALRIQCKDGLYLQFLDSYSPRTLAFLHGPLLNLYLAWATFPSDTLWIFMEPCYLDFDLPFNDNPINMQPAIWFFLFAAFP
jgi:hypothetical protein